MVENIARTRIDLLSRPLVCQDPYLLEVLQSDLNRHDCTVLTAHLSALATHAFTPEATTTYQMLEPFSALLKGKLEVIQDLRSRLKLRCVPGLLFPHLEYILLKHAGQECEDLLPQRSAYITCKNATKVANRRHGCIRGARTLRDLLLQTSQRFIRHLQSTAPESRRFN